jgi:hypothetical protein
LQPQWARSARIRFDVIAWQVEPDDRWRVTHVASAFDAQG